MPSRHLLPGPLPLFGLPHQTILVGRNFAALVCARQNNEGQKIFLARG